ncbi:MAG TPA: type II toxin-antitoxin system Phd/YefM family antitoxin [Roseiflexaceae bacterium]|jgi:prevent-host-death family protein|nr:type II toxin-antitoxin system Phd/YefM family antitoxin [Roseiflexaceae bacterium]
MSVTVNIHEAKTHFSKLLRYVLDGEEVVISRAGVPIARLVPFDERPASRVPGSAKGKLVVPPDFNAPLPDEVLTSFE